MIPRLIFISLLISISSFGQLKGKGYTFDSDGFCGSSIHFITDSTADFLIGCESTQLFTKLKYEVANNGNLIFHKVPDSLYRPIISLTKGEVVFDSYDSLYGLPKLVLMNSGSTWTESYWKMSGDTTLRQSGHYLRQIPEQFFTDTTLKIHFVELDKLKDTLPDFDYMDFEGSGSVYIVNTDAPYAFMIYSDMHFRPDLCDTSKLKFRMINNKLHVFENSKWVLVER